MSTFGTIDIAGSGLIVYRKWLDAVSDNIANINDVRSTSDDAFQARYVVAQAVDYGERRRGAGRGHRARRRARAGSSTSPTTRWPTRTATSACPTSTSPTR